jgi:predicted Rossmann fold nucleotide-binding protein DprA/Smf involved in DNA uptake
MVAPPDLSPLQLSLWTDLAERRHVDALAIRAQASPPAVLTALTELELRGLVQQQPGMHFVRA